MNGMKNTKIAFLAEILKLIYPNTFIILNFKI